MICAIDTETTGLNPDYHEIVQVAFLPLNDDFTPAEDPFYVNIMPTYPERWDDEAAEINGLKGVEGLSQHTAMKLLLARFPEPVIPLAKNWAFDYSFLKNWFNRVGVPLETVIDRRRARDLQTVIHFLNDRGAKLPSSLGPLCEHLDIPLIDAHDALADCYATARAYRTLKTRSL